MKPASSPRTTCSSTSSARASSPGLASRTKPCAAQNPRLVICALTGYGQTGVPRPARRPRHRLPGPRRQPRRPGPGRRGAAGARLPARGHQRGDVVRDRHPGRPRRARAHGAGPRARHRHDRRRPLGFNAMAVGAALAGIDVRRGDEPLTGGIAPYGTYLSSDGHPIALGALEPKFWAAFCAAVGLEVDMTALFPGPHQADLKAKGRRRLRREDPRRVGRLRRPARLLPGARPRPRRRSPGIPTSPPAASSSELPTPRGPVPQLRTPVTPRDEASSPRRRLGWASTRGRSWATRGSRRRRSTR